MNLFKELSGEIYQAIVLISIVTLIFIIFFKSGEVNEFLIGTLAGAMLPLKAANSLDKS